MKKVIVAGKGGSGKTTLCALLIQSIISTKQGADLLVIDADPAHNLLLRLGLQQPEDIQAIGELSNLVPDDWENYNSLMFSSLKQLCIKKICYKNSFFDYGYLGHHFNNSCMCAFNNSLNYILRHINHFSDQGDTNKYDYVLIDREAGVEHINRSVYGGKDDKLIITTWPTREYLEVTKIIVDTANMLGSTKERMIVINNLIGLNLSEKEIENMLKEYFPIVYPEINYLILPRLRIDNVNSVIDIDQSNGSLENVISGLINFIDM